MKKIALASLLLSGFLVPSFNLVYAGEMEDAEKIRELENKLKMTSSSRTANPSNVNEGKRKTRAIVMDISEVKKNDTGGDSVPASSTELADCSAVRDDSKAVTVDFSIQFKAGKSEVASSSENTLRQISRILALTPERCVLVEGHSDVSGNFNTNMDLSKDRAASVVKFVAEKSGLDKSRFISIGKGSTEPLKNTDPRDAKNRRVVFKVIG